MKKMSAKKIDERRIGVALLRRAGLVFQKLLLGMRRNSPTGVHVYMEVQWDCEDDRPGVDMWAWDDDIYCGFNTWHAMVSGGDPDKAVTSDGDIVVHSREALEAMHRHVGEALKRTYHENEPPMAEPPT